VLHWLPLLLLLLVLCDRDAHVAVQPADSRVVVFDSVDAAHRFW